MAVELDVHGQRHAFEAPAIVEFAGGATEVSDDAF
jgi:hypothetical protein